MSLSNILRCKICEESYNSKDHTPTVICSNQHTSCLTCTSSLSACPFCRIPKLPKPVTNHALLDVVTLSKSGEFLCEIPESDLEIDFSKPLGVGGSSRVYSGTWNNATIAVKVVLCNSEKDRLRLRKELLTLFNLSHPCVLRVFGLVWLPENQLGIVMEKASASLTVPSSVSLLSLTYAKQIVEALLHLHSHNILHGDLKPENVLIVGGAARLSDFGTSKVLSETTTHGTNQLNFTLKYVAPEALSNTKSLKSDIYSLGMMLYELFCNESLFEGYDAAAIVGAKMGTLQSNFPPNIDQRIVDLISSCCHLDMNERPSLEDIYESLNKLSKEFPKDCKSIEEKTNYHVDDRSSTDLENLNKQKSQLSDRVLSLQSEIFDKSRELSESQQLSTNLKNIISKLELELKSMVHESVFSSVNNQLASIKQKNSEIDAENSRLKDQLTQLSRDLEQENSSLSMQGTSTEVSSSVPQSNLINFFRTRRYSLFQAIGRKTTASVEPNSGYKNILGEDPLLPGNEYTWKLRYRGRDRYLFVGVIDESKFKVDGYWSWEWAHCFENDGDRIRGCLSGIKNKWNAGELLEISANLITYTLTIKTVGSPYINLTGTLPRLRSGNYYPFALLGKSDHVLQVVA
ncbi:hypothetical protein GEMRC1_000776 [Eukaryota sp. GEM-RC1]